MFAAASYPDPWRFVPNPEVYLLVAFLIGAYVYLVRVLQPSAVAAGAAPVSRRQWGAFAAAMVVLFFAGTWPLHQVGEDYLYFMHMVQHLLLSMVLPPLIWMATPAWLLRVLIGQGRLLRVVRFMSKPVAAAAGYNVMVAVLHIPGVVNASTTNGTLHFGLHLLVVLSSVVLWFPVIGPLPEMQLGYGAKMVYLFLSSVISTVPAMWMAMADGVVYDHYGDQPVRVWGMSAMEDQQIAGIIMKTGGGLYLWAVILTMFVRRFSREQKAGGAAPAATAAPSASPARVG